MLKLILGTNWKKNTDKICRMVSDDVAKELGGCILLVPESISHNTERLLCEYAGDTASRFAEVLSFSRFPDRLRDANGCGEYACMDNGGRVVAMAAAAVQLHSKLKAYASVETRPEFLINLVDAVDEFKCCCITAEDLMLASKRSQGSFAQKLEELSLLLQAYDALCHRSRRDPRDLLSWVLEQLEDSSFAQDHRFYFDGFTDFTGQQLAIVRHLIGHSDTVTVCLNCDKPGSSDPAFEKAGMTATTLLRFAKELGVSVQIEVVEPGDSALQAMCAHLFKGNILTGQQLENCVRVYQTESVVEECNAAAQLIMDRVRGGARFRDICVACTDMAVYSNVLKMSFDRYGIPIYFSGTEDILDMPIINTVLSALEAVTNGFDQKAVMRYLRSYLSPIDAETCDRIENYAFLWNIRGDRWKHEWTNHPEGLGLEMDESSAATLKQLNEARITALAPLIRLENGLDYSTTLRQQIQALYVFLNEIQLAYRLGQMAEYAAQDGENATIQVFSQLWEILVCALEQLHDVLGESSWETENFTRLLKLLLSQYDVGTIPPVLDAVTVGSVSSLRCYQQKHLIVLGALEGCLPSYGGVQGVLTELERSELRLMGVPLTGGALDSLQSEFADIYNVFCGANESITVSCPAGQPSYVYKRILAAVGKTVPVDTVLGAAESNASEAGAYIARHGTAQDAARLSLSDSYDQSVKSAQHCLGTISQEGIRALYGNKLYLSASKIDKVADCRLSYFLKYGLRARERKEATVDPAEFGTYVHDVLENTARKLKEMGGFRSVSLEKTLEIANQYAKEYAAAHFSQIDSQRLNYLFDRNAKELEMIVAELWDEMRNSEFEPFDFELGFGKDGKMDSIAFSGKNMQAQLEGFVDRVDTWNNGYQNYFRVVDYKTGKKDFDYCDVYNGLGLQMLLYMFALEDNGGDLLGERPIPAGVQYFPARIPVIPTDGVLSEEEIQEERVKKLTRKGLLLQDEAVLRAMEPFDKPVRMNYSRKKDGTLTGNLADREQMKLLKSYVFALLGNIVDDIASGCVDPNPYTRGSEHNACRFCPYGAICHPAFVEGRRDYKTMSAQWFWEAVGKELQKHG